MDMISPNHRLFISNVCEEDVVCYFHLPPAVVIAACVSDSGLDWSALLSGICPAPGMGMSLLTEAWGWLWF